MEKEKITQLMKLKLFGLIGLEDDLELQRVMDADPDLQEEFQQLRKEVIAFDESPAMAGWTEEESYDRVMNDVWSKKKRKRGIRWILTAACAAILITFVVRLLPQMQQKETTAKNIHPTASVNSNTSQLLLTTAGGQSVNVGTQEEWEVDGAKLTNKGKTLSFQAPDEVDASGMNKLWVPVGMDYHLVLADGSEVFLNSASSLEFPFKFKGDTREVRLKGEAYFKIAKKEHQPFIVKSDLGEVRVLGTAFNLNNYAQQSVKVSLVEGAVAFTSGVEQLRLKPGDAVTYEVDKGMRKAALNEDDLLWMKGQYHLDNTQLGEVAAVLERWYGVKVVFKRPGIKTERFTGTIFKKEPLDDFLRTLEVTSGIKHDTKDDTTTLW